MDVVGGYRLDPFAEGDLDQGVVAGRVEGMAVIPQLDKHVVASEAFDELAQSSPGLGGTVFDQGTHHRSFAAPGEDHPVGATPEMGQGVEVDSGRPFFALHLGLADGASQATVSAGPPG